MGNSSVIAPGARVRIRDAEWVVKRVDRSSDGGEAISVIGIDELVKDREATFLSNIETDIEIVDPLQTDFVMDESPYYRNSLLYMESLLRATTPTDFIGQEKLYTGHNAAMDLLPYQLEPALHTLQQPRHRILIADSVGLGKTLEAGILLTELMKRGKGKRILVVAVKSMLTQFQKEMWSRFTIPLTRLDSVGIQRIRSRIPTNHNPFYYYDKAIISMDTLKQDSEYRTYLENCYWDVIVIDEAHNVAERGSNSMRSRLAKLLASRSDSLIMLSATPHDGKAKSFASLMNMLNPTAIANQDDYGPEDIKGLYIRRFKKDVKDQLENAFKDRTIEVAKTNAGEIEEDAYKILTEMKFHRLDQRKGAAMLFRTTLEKSLFSSPAACIKTIQNRIKKLEKEETSEALADTDALVSLEAELKRITPNDFAKYQNLLNVIQDKKEGFGWKANKTDDRLIIFTERIETMNYLYENLAENLNLKEKQIAILHGGMSDVDQQEVVEEFGKDSSSIRLLIASDVASEGINLHYLCHRMIHFDVPWSLMVFQQRNGRIDRYGQEKEPQIVYMMTESSCPKIRGDYRILELLIEKDKEAHKNIGDPSVFMNVYDVDEEETVTASAIEKNKSAEDFDKELNDNLNADNIDFDPFAMFGNGEDIPVGDDIENRKTAIPSLFTNELSFFREATEYLKHHQKIQVSIGKDGFVNLVPPEDLKQHLRHHPREIWPEKNEFILTEDKSAIMEEIKKCRKEENAWPRINLLWEHHPIMEWMSNKLMSAFGRQQAPVLAVNTLDKDDMIFIIAGLIPNRKGHPLIYEWVGVVFKDGIYQTVDELPEVIRHHKLDAGNLPNSREEFSVDDIKNALPSALENVREWISLRKEEFNDKLGPVLKENLDSLDALRKKRFEQLEFKFEGITQKHRKERESRDIEKIFSEYQEWIKDTMTIEDNPYIKVVAVLRGTE